MKLIASFLLLLISGLAQAATLSAQSMNETPVAPTYNAADTGNGDKVLNPSGNVFLHFKNTHASNASTVTITAQKTSVRRPGMGLLTKANISVSLPALSESIVGPFPRDAFNDASGFVNWSYSGTGTVSVAVIQADLLVPQLP